MQLKHLVVFLLFLVISVAECTVYSQNNTSNYYQSSKLNHTKKLFSKNTKLVVFNKNSVTDNYFFTFLYSEIHIKCEFQKQVHLTIKLQKKRYQEIASINSQHIFLINKITSSNSTSNLYIA